jgi:hypothetical protein
METIDKYQIDWQIVRARAKKLKDYAEKISLVKDFILSNTTIENIERASNWANMSVLGYKSKNIQAAAAFTNFVCYLDENFEDAENEVFENDFTKYKFEDLEMLLKDLKSRKFDFQYNGVPKAQEMFVEELENYILDNKPTQQLNPSQYYRAYKKGRFEDDKKETTAAATEKKEVTKKKKLSDEQVRTIRASEEKNSVLAKEYDCSPQLIYNVKKGKLYKDVK